MSDKLRKYDKTPKNHITAILLFKVRKGKYSKILLNCKKFSFAAALSKPKKSKLKTKRFLLSQNFGLTVFQRLKQNYMLSDPQNYILLKNYI